MIRQLFNALSPRERFFLTVFAWLLLVFWMVYLSDEIEAKIQVSENIENQLLQQQVLLDNAESIEASLIEVREGLDPTRTYSGDQLFARLDSMLRQAGITFDITSPRSRSEGIFNVHTVGLTLRRVRMRELITFVNEIQQERPYINLEEFELDPQRRNPSYLDAQFQVSSFEFTREF